MTTLLILAAVFAAQMAFTATTTALWHAVRAAWAIAVISGEMTVPNLSGPWADQVRTGPSARAFARHCILRQWAWAAVALVAAASCGAALTALIS